MLKRRRTKANRRVSDMRDSSSQGERVVDESADVALAPTRPCETCGEPVSLRYMFTQCARCCMTALKAALEPYYERKKQEARDRFEKMRLDKIKQEEAR